MLPFSSFSQEFEVPLSLGKDGIVGISASSEGTFIEITTQGKTQEESPLFNITASDTAHFLTRNGIKFTPNITHFPSVPIESPPRAAEHGAAESPPWSERVTSEKVVASLKISHDDAIKLYGVLYGEGKLTLEQRDRLQGDTLQVVEMERERIKNEASMRNLDQPAFLRNKGHGPEKHGKRHH